MPRFSFEAISDRVRNAGEVWGEKPLVVEIDEGRRVVVEGIAFEDRGGDDLKVVLLAGADEYGDQAAAKVNDAHREKGR